MSLLKRLRRWFRDAVTGRFVSRKYAEENPDTTVGESAAELADRLKRENDL